MKLVEDIESYIKLMKDICESINQLQGEKFLENHKKTLFFSLIESISTGVYGNQELSNSKRFQRFIKEFCEWEDTTRVSLQQLALLLEETEKNEYQELKGHVALKINNYPDASAIPFKYDSTIEEIKELMPKTQTKINGVDINLLTHGSLLWKFRNTLVHEARSLGSIKLFFNENPHYVHFTIFDKLDEKEIWEIYYPNEFFNRIVKIALDNVREFLLENKVDPRKNYNLGKLWVKPRNSNRLHL